MADLKNRKMNQRAPKLEMIQLCCCLSFVNSPGDPKKKKHVLLHSFSVEVILSYHNHLPGLLLFCPQRLEKKITWAKNTSLRKEVCLLLPGELLSSLQLIIQHFPGSGPSYDAKTVGRRLNKFLLFILRQCVCVHALAGCPVVYVRIQKL